MTKYYNKSFFKKKKKMKKLRKKARKLVEGWVAIGIVKKTPVPMVQISETSC